MKNLHILPTDKPSRLYLNGFQRLVLDDKIEIADDNSFTNQHIYITSDEEIKDVRPHKGKWQLEKGEILNKFPNYLTDLSECKLVIITTDPDLIKDGVQAIDDKFLEWFVNNPSCEEVEVKYDKDIFPYGVETSNGYGWYKIIIPKEEPKQETLEEVAHEMLVDYGIKSIGQSIGVPTVKKLMVNMAKWQAERMHSEEDLKEAFEAGHKKGFSGYPNTENWKELPFEKWFEQFKKK